jgi:hypothetical protein
MLGDANWRQKDDTRCRTEIRPPSSPQGMHNLAVGNAHGSEAPGNRRPSRRRIPEAEGLQPFQG